MDQPAQIITETVSTPPSVPVNPSPIPASSPVIPKKINKFPLIFLMVLVVGIVGAAAFWLGKSSGGSNVAIPTPTVVPTVSEPSPTQDPTANWETYTNLELGFSIKYPQEILEIKDNGFEPIQKLSNGGVPYAIFFTEFKNPANLPLQDLVAKTYNYDDEIKQKIKYSPKTIGPYTVNTTEDLLSQDGSKDVFFTKDGQNYLDISMTPLKEANIIFDQILSTFKFLP